ncbi:LAML3 protein, partial [Atlantisia rogersi]|nr:LAML3 protein [Atlantisia rogersi]
AAMATVFTSTPKSGSRSISQTVAAVVSPTQLSRLLHKDELRQLNGRLTVYIERVRELEAENSALQQRLAEQEANCDRELSCLRLSYEAELADARRVLNDIALDRATLQVELGKIGEEHQQLHSRNSKKEADLNVAQARIKDLDAQLHAKEVELATVLNVKRTLENDLGELKAQLVTLQLSLEDTKKHLHSEMLKTADLENKIKTSQEQMKFQKRLHDYVLKEAKIVRESRLVETPSGRKRELESKLSDVLQGLRKQHEERIQEYREELERVFNAKVENIQLFAAKKSDFADAAREELMEIKLRLDAMIAQNNQYQSQNVALRNRVKELEETVEYDRDLHQRRIAEKEKEVERVQQRTQEQLEDYGHLLDAKLALDMEINAYRKMLEREEQRLKLSPSPSSHSTASQGRQFLYGKKRKMKEARKRRHSAGFQTVQHASFSGNISIEEIDSDGKYVRLKNNSDEDQLLHGWVLRRHLGNVSDVTYQFPSLFTLQAGQVITIWGAAAGVSPGPNDLVWKSQKSWGTEGNIEVTLITDDGEELAERKIMYVPRAEESDEQDDDEYEVVTGSEMQLPSQTKRRRKKKCCLVS